MVNGRFNFQQNKLTYMQIKKNVGSVYDACACDAAQLE